ncbi:MAG: acetolactate synthase small subunit [Candidatus Dormibacteraceae bacterium]
MNTPDLTTERIRILWLEAENNPGVLSRVTGMIRRRGFNIQSISAAPTERPNRSRMTLSVDAGGGEVDQVEKQLDRLIEVTDIADITEQKELVRELLLVRLNGVGERQEELNKLLAEAGGRIIEEEAGELTVEISGWHHSMPRLISELGSFGIIGLARSGPLAISGK